MPLRHVWPCLSFRAQGWGQVSLASTLPLQGPNGASGPSLALQASGAHERSRLAAAPTRSPDPLHSTAAAVA